MTDSEVRAPAGFCRIDFDRGRSRLGNGELGGKAQGLVFFNQMLESEYDPSRFPQVEVVVPAFAVVSTDVFDEFLDCNALGHIRFSELSDEEIASRFQAAELPPRLVAFLTELIQEVSEPLAVRSSSLTEDAIFCPLAGVYETKMIPNNQAGQDERLRKVQEAIKLVYASTFFAEARTYLHALDRALADEKMAVIIQEVVGSVRGDRYYPHLSGVARSHNFYPSAGMRSADGVVSLALGLGKTIVEGGVCWTYSPARPKAPPPFGSVGDLLKNSQLSFWAVNLAPPAEANPIAETEHLVRTGLAAAETDGTLELVASTCQSGTDRVVPGTGSPGARIVTFAPLLDLEMLPLNDVVRELVEICERAAGADVEIEFALSVREEDGAARLGFLQVRPMFVSHESVEIRDEEFARSDLVLASRHVMGNGSVDDIRDVVYLKREGFDGSRTPRIAAELEKTNRRLLERGRPYALLGFGRWGSADPWLGVPVSWAQISGAKVIVESSLPNLPLDPSQASHFFHNVMSTGVSYLAVQCHDEPGIDWEWLDRQSAREEGEFLRHVELSQALRIRVDGRNGRAGIWTDRTSLSETPTDTASGSATRPQ